jgi:hypothetical protein
MTIFDHISIKVGDSVAMNAFYKAALAPLSVTQKFLVERTEVPHRWIRPRAGRGGSGNLHSGDKWNFRLPSA